MNGVHLTGLEGTNPLGFMAALGVQVAFEHERNQPRMWWSNDITPHAIVDEGFTVERIANRALEVLDDWRKSPAANPKRADGSAMPKGDELKLTPKDLRSYLNHAGMAGQANHLASALVAEGSLDNQGVSKPSDLYFAAGQQKFLDTVRKILISVVPDDIIVGLIGPWHYKSKLPSLGWDVSDDRVYALRATDPSDEKKPTNPGPEALAILGLSVHPVFAGGGRTLTQGCSGSWKKGYYSWPIWRKSASHLAVKSLLAHASRYDPTSANRSAWFKSWGVSAVLRSPIRRSGQGGYGTFGPPEVAWQAT